MNRVERDLFLNALERKLSDIAYLIITILLVVFSVIIIIDAVLIAIKMLFTIFQIN